VDLHRGHRHRVRSVAHDGQPDREIPLESYDTFATMDLLAALMVLTASDPALPIQRARARARTPTRRRPYAPPSA
jgi:hypothetical protein